jgi:carbon-monoxide dehydrogenase large subunit
MRTVNTYIGSPVERVEDYRFLRGEGQSVGDLVREGQWHAAFVRSPVGHGVIRTIDCSAALAWPGVKAVLTAADIEGEIPKIPFRRPNPTIGPYAQPIIASGKVRYFGEPVAVILAESAEIAEDALAAIVLDIEPAIAASRIQRGQDRLEKRGIEYFEKVRDGFLSQLPCCPGRTAIVEANQDIQAIHREIIAIVKEEIDF